MLAGDAGLEPTHVAVKVLCLTDLANPLYKCGERTGIRTPDTRLRRALLYPAELCTHIVFLERETRFELATSTLARLRSTTELLPLIIFYMVRMKGVEPPRRKAPDPKSGASANSATSAHIKFGGGWWIRTTEIVDNRFTVCPLWPLGKSSVLWS